MDTAAEFIQQTAASRTTAHRLDLLALLTAARGGASGSTIVAEQDANRETVYRRLHEFVDIGFIEDLGQAGFRTTRAGEKGAAVYRQAADRVGDDALLYLARSNHRRQLIRALREASMTKSELAAGDEGPSRKTIRRTLQEFDERGWLRKPDPGRVVATEQATKSFAEYERLITATEQAIEKSPCIQTLAYWANPPLSAFANSELVIETEEEPHAMLDATVEAAGLRDGGLRHLRTIVPLFDPVMYDLFNQYIGSESTFEIVFDQRTYHRLTEATNLPYLAKSIIAPNTSVRIHPDPLYTGLGIYNDQTVMLGGSSRYEEDAAAVGGNESLLRWANETFDMIWKESQPPSERLREWIDQVTSSAMEWSELLAQRETV